MKTKYKVIGIVSLVVAIVILGTCENNLEVDGKHVGYQFSFSGGMTIWRNETEVDTQAHITYHLETTTSKCKIVLITAHNEVKTLAENIKPEDTEGGIEVDLPQGENRIELICQNKGVGNVEIDIEDKV